MREVSLQWLNKADEDLELMRQIQENDYLTNMVAFHAQQAVEKCFKAIIEEFQLAIPRIHKLETLYRKIEDYVGFSVDIGMLKQLDQIYTSSRYPGDLGLFPEGKPLPKDAKAFSVKREAWSVKREA